MMKIKLFAENADGVDESQVDALQAEVAQGETQATEDLGQIDQVAAVIEDAVEGIGELEAQADIAQTAIDEGEGISEPHAQAAQVTVESVCRRLGVTPSEVGIRLNTESFGAGNSKLAQTKLFVESVTETVKKVWKQVVDFLKNLWNRIKEFFAKFFDNSEKAEKAAKAAKDRVAKVEGEAEKKTIKGGRVAEAFRIDGNVSPNTVKVILENHTKMLNGLGNLTDATVKALSALDKGVGTGFEGKLEDSLKLQLKELVQSGMKSLGDVSAIGADKDGFVVMLGSMVGGADVSIEVTCSNTFATKMEMKSNDTKKAPEEIPVLTVAEMGAVLDVAIAAAQKTTEYKKQLPKLDAMNKESVKLAEAAMRFAEKIADQSENKGNLKSVLADARTTVTSLSNQVNRFCTMLPAWTVKGVNTAVSYVDQSIAQYKKKAA